MVTLVQVALYLNCTTQRISIQIFLDLDIRCISKM